MPHRSLARNRAGRKPLVWLSLAALLGLTAFAPAPPAPTTGSQIESSLAVEESLGPGAVLGSELWVMVTRWEKVTTKVVEHGPDGAASTSYSGDGHRLQDAYSLVRLDLLSGTRKTVVEDGVIDVKSDGRAIYGLAQWEKGRGYGVTAYHGETRVAMPVLPLAKGDEPVSLIIDRGRPVVLSHRALLRLRPDGRRWSSITLGEKIAAAPEAVASPSTGGVVFATGPKGFDRIDLKTGVVTRIALPGGVCQASACDSIRNLAPDPSSPACVLASSGAAADQAPHGAVIRLCRDKAELVWSRVMAAPMGSSAAITTVAPAENGFWASTTPDGLFLVRGGDAKAYRLDHSRNLGGLKVICLPDAVAVTVRATTLEAPLLLSDPDRVCHDA